MYMYLRVNMYSTCDVDQVMYDHHGNLNQLL